MFMCLLREFFILNCQIYFYMIYEFYLLLRVVSNLLDIHMIFFILKFHLAVICMGTKTSIRFLHSVNEMYHCTTTIL